MLVLTFQVGKDRLALDIRRVREVVPRVELARAAGSPPWLAGSFVYRGRVVSVLDLHGLLGAGECPPHLSSRIILVPVGEGEMLLGLLAAQVADIKEIAPGHSVPVLSSPGRPDLGRAIVDDGGILHLIDLGRLLPEPVRQMVPLLPGGPA
jgi:chemotaxis signal transduction protein